jgi:hypothetical protein
MKKVIKKAVAKKPMMKKGRVKKPLRKAQYGDRVFSGPLNKSDIERLDRAYPSTAPVTIPQAPKEADLIRGFNPFVNGQMVSNEEREAMERKDGENYIRSKRFKKGGPVKSTTKKSLIKAQDGKIIKSKKVRTADINDFGPSSASVSRTNRKGTTVTKSINTNQGYVPTASKTKTVTDSKGNTASTTKDMSWNKALKKQERITKKIGRNPNDEIRGEMYKKGGTVKSKAKKMADGGPTGIQKVRRNILTNRIDNLNQKGNQNLNSGNKEKAFNQFDKADKLQQRRSDIRQKAGYKKGGLIKSKKK